MQPSHNNPHEAFRLETITNYRLVSHVLIYALIPGEKLIRGSEAIIDFQLMWAEMKGEDVKRRMANKRFRFAHED